MTDSYPDSAATSTAQRKLLPNRRLAVTTDLEIRGQRYVMTVGFFPGTEEPAEIFISATKVGSEADTNARDASVITSIALQYGVPLDVLRRAVMRDSHGFGSGPLAVALDRIAAEASL